ncbi:MAG: Rne/Rng family ribonuclease [Desulfobacterales bacterium]|nr:Rne/Rng family ribonuclease [Desulfobacterales bacterium]
MTSKILINSVDPEECRIAKVTNSRLEEFHLETTSRESIQGNIYKAVITRVEPSLQAVFVDFGGERNGFLQKQEIHSSYFSEASENEKNLSRLVKRGQELIVQVTKNPVGSKGAMLTTFISLPGRHAVLMPGSSNRGVSRQIEDEKERTRLKEIIGKLKLAEGYGLIVRTAGENCNKTMISKDVTYLTKVWKDLNKQAANTPGPTLLYKEKNLAVRAIRDYLTPDVSEILVDNPDAFKEIKEFIRLIAPKHVKLTKLYSGDKPIFTKHQLEHQIASIFESRVSLNSGGSIVIDQTEALVAIDVNSGKGTQKKNIEQTALMTNLEAAEEVARQLRLRDLGGLIVIDFIDMKEAKNRSAVESTLKENLKSDKARTKVGRISRFGLLEMSRQRIRPSIEFGSMVPCRHCKGKGMILSTETVALAFLRKLSLETLKDGISSANGYVPQDVADYLLNKKRAEILDIETKRDISISIEGNRSMVHGDSRIICE